MLSSLLESLALVSSFTDFKLVGKTVTLLALVMAKHSSDSTFYTLVISTFS